MASTGQPGIQIIPNLIQGVSQQPAPSRRDAQCEEQFDCVNSALEGCAARPPTEFKKLYTGKSWDNAMFSETSHGNNENYLIGVSNSGAPFAIDLIDGTECTVSVTAPDTAYLSSGTSTPADKLRAQVIEDTTFICNREVLAAMASTTSAVKVNEVLLFIRATAFDANYRVDLSGPGTATITVTTGAATVAPTDRIALAMTDGTVQTGISITAGAALHGQGGYSVDRYHSILRIYRADGQAFNIGTSDGNGDVNMVSFNGEASGFEKLPARGFNGMIIKVSGDRNTDQDDYYVKFSGNGSTGRWKETVGPGVHTSLNAATLPHTMVLTGYRTFEFRRPTWSTRIAGDEDTAKDPGFIGRGIRDMIYHSRRLALIYDSGVDFSKSQNPYTFFPDTVQTVLADAPVGLTLSSGDKRGASIIDFGSFAQENLFFWAQRVQFRVASSGEIFKQDTVEAIPSMAYQYSPGVYPLPTQGFVFLLTDNGAFSTVRALQFAQTKLSGDVDLISHSPAYVASGSNLFISHDTLRYVLVASPDKPGVLYLLNYTFSSEQGFIQTGVNTWRIGGGKILWAGFRENTLRILQQRPEGVALLHMDLTPLRKDSDPNAGYLTRLDNRLTEADTTMVYNAGANTTTITLPYQPTGADVMVVTRQDKVDGYTRGREFSVVGTSGYDVTVTGDATGYLFYVGQRITALRRESQFFVRTDKGPMPNDFLTVGRFYLTTANTGYTRIEVSSPNRTTRQYATPLRILGSTTAVLGTPQMVNHSLQAELGDRPENIQIDIINDSFMPSYWHAAAYSYSPVGWAGIK